MNRTRDNSQTSYRLHYGFRSSGEAVYILLSSSLWTKTKCIFLDCVWLASPSCLLACCSNCFWQNPVSDNNREQQHTRTLILSGPGVKDYVFSFLTAIRIFCSFCINITTPLNRIKKLWITNVFFCSCVNPDFDFACAVSLFVSAAVEAEDRPTHQNVDRLLANLLEVQQQI